MDANSEIERLERRIGHVERELQAQGSAVALIGEKVSSMEARSEERLLYLKERFDKIDGRWDREDRQARWLGGLVYGVVGSVCLAFFYIWMEPLSESVEELGDRLRYVEQTVSKLHNSDNPE